MSYKGYSFNLHKEDDKGLIDWLSNKKVTRTIKTALYNQMKSESNVADNNSVELLSAIKKVIESNSVINGKQPEIARPNENENEKSLDGEDAEDFEKIFDI